MSAIKEGDLVQVVRPRHCGCNTYVGRIFVVTGFISEHRVQHCATCGDKSVERDIRAFGCRTVMPGSRAAISLYRLKRIPPLEELERDKLVEKLRELI